MVIHDDLRQHNKDKESQGHKNGYRPSRTYKFIKKDQQHEEVYDIICCKFYNIISAKFDCTNN